MHLSNTTNNQLTYLIPDNRRDQIKTGRDGPKKKRKQNTSNNHDTT
jgi:hypothetical protein